MWETFIIHAALGVLRTVIKNPALAGALKGTLLLIRDDINSLYPDSAASAISGKTRIA
jgi:hypothetical protein